MKKIAAVLILAFCFAMSSVMYTLAGSVDSDENLVNNFTITSGIDLEKDSETTFNSTRIISGTAENNTEVYITVYEVIEDEDEIEYVEVEEYETTVGLSEIFSQTVSLNLGKNMVVVKAVNGECTSEVSTIIKRKNSEIKNELQQGIALPGQGWQP